MNLNLVWGAREFDDHAKGEAQMTYISVACSGIENA